MESRILHFINRELEKMKTSFRNFCAHQNLTFQTAKYADAKRSMNVSCMAKSFQHPHMQACPEYLMRNAIRPIKKKLWADLYRCM